METIIIEHLGQTLETKFHKELTDEEFNTYKEQYYRKPPFEDVQAQFIKVSHGSTTNNVINPIIIIFPTITSSLTSQKSPLLFFYD